MAQVIKLKRSSTEGAEPTTSDLALGEVGINTYDGKMFIKKDDGTASIVELGTGGSSVFTTTTTTATANQTTVTGLTYTVGLINVYLNGVKLVVGTDVTATSGTSIVLAAGAAADDIIQTVAFTPGAAFTPASPTFTGTLTAPTINASVALQIGGTAITSTAAELNILDGVTATATELNYVDGVTSAIQTQLTALESGGGYSSSTISTNTTIDADTHYTTGKALIINNGITFTVPVDSLLEVAVYTTGKAL